MAATTAEMADNAPVWGVPMAYVDQTMASLPLRELGPDFIPEIFDDWSIGPKSGFAFLG
jgi:hypothetical protein